jgi:ABC-2 type transport system permease protein
VIPSLARPYLAVAGARFRLLLQYRAAALAGFITQCWWGAIKIMVLTAFYSGAATTPMTLRQTIDYIWLAQRPCSSCRPGRATRASLRALRERNH